MAPGATTSLPSSVDWRVDADLTADVECQIICNGDFGCDPTTITGGANYWIAAFSEWLRHVESRRALLDKAAVAPRRGFSQKLTAIGCDVSTWEVIG